MKLNVLSQEFYNDRASQKLINILKNIFSNDDSVMVFYRFPLIKELDQEVKYPHVLAISKKFGVIAIKCSSIERERGDSIKEMSDEILWIEDYLFSKLIKSNSKKIKSGKRSLSFNLTSALFMPDYVDEINVDEIESDVLHNETDIKSFIKKNEDDEIDDSVLQEIFSIIEGSTAIIRPKERKISEDDTSSKAFILKQMEQEIAVFDEEQKYAALSQLNGPQRIRGLAGTGKTIILAMKAALIHLANPNAKILYTFMTKSLYDYIEKLITRFYKTLGDGNIPDFEECIHIRHAWGGINVKGVYYDCCVREGVAPIGFNAAKNKADDAFDYVCKDLLERKNGKFDKYYNYVLIDEAQDFKPAFYQLCRAIVKNDSIVWGYDDLQNIFDVKIQDTIHTFENEYGYEGINLPKLQEQYPEMENDIVLSKSYRNPKEILVLAHAVGFGIYNDTILQTLENNEHWKDLGYNVVSGNCKNGDEMVVERPDDNSPLSISKKQKPDELIKVYSASSMDNEAMWIVNQIQVAISKDKLRPDDIIVISLDDRYARRYFTKISQELFSHGIRTYNLSATSYQKGFYEDDCVTLTTLYKAKGNEAAMVFVIGCDACRSHKNNIVTRNKLFTAFTRTKAWLRITGCSIESDWLVEEINKVKKNNFILKYTYKEASVIKRDLADINLQKTREREEMQRYVKDAKKKGISRKEIEQMLLAEFGDEKN